MKTAALCVAKIYDIDPDIVIENGFISMLKKLLSSTNPAVVANAVAALCEIDDVAPEPVFKLTRSNLSKLVTALDACTEWGQVFILNSLARYVPETPKEAEVISDKVSPRLAHANPAVVVGAIKVILSFIDYVKSRDLAKKLIKRLRPPLGM